MSALHGDMDDDQDGAPENQALVRAALTLAEAAVAMLDMDHGVHPVVQAKRAYRAETTDALEEHYMVALMRYYRLRSAPSAPTTSSRR